MNRRVLGLAAVAAALVTPAFVEHTWSAFTGQTASASNAFATSRIFSGTRTTSAWKVQDFATGSLVNRSDTVSFAGDGLATDTNALPTAYSPDKYIEFQPESSLPAGLAVSNTTLRLNLARTGTAGTLRFFVDVRRESTGAVLGTHGSAAAPLGTLTTTTHSAFTVTLPEVTTSGTANDLAIRVYAWDTASGALNIDRVQVDGSTPYASFTLLRWSAIGTFAASPATYPWALTGPGATAVTTGSWTTAFASTRYLSLYFEPDLPPGATVTNVTLTHAFRPASGGTETQCVYYQARLGTTVIGSSFGGISAATPSCTASSYKTDTVTLTGVDTAGEVNGLEVRIHGRNSASRASDHDQATLAVTYKLD